jgi:hypothetical protein
MNNAVIVHVDIMQGWTDNTVIVSVCPHSDVGPGERWRWGNGECKGRLHRNLGRAIHGVHTMMTSDKLYPREARPKIHTIRLLIADPILDQYFRDELETMLAVDMIGRPPKSTRSNREAFI